MCKIRVEALTAHASDEEIVTDEQFSLHIYESTCFVEIEKSCRMFICEHVSVYYRR